MGIYLNPGNDSFWRAIRSEIYVDKTELIAHTNRYINTEQQYICVSRPRRFGKSMALNMLVAYYSRGCDSAELFKGYKIAQKESFQKHLNGYDVIYLNMQRFLIRAKNQEVKCPAASCGAFHPRGSRQMSASSHLARCSRE